VLSDCLHVIIEVGFLDGRFELAKEQPKKPLNSSD